MAEELSQHPSGDQPGVQLVLDERELRTMFSNAYRIHTTAEEAVLDFGFNMANPNPQSGQHQLLFKVNERIIMSYPNLKRLAGQLLQVIKRYESQFGEIQASPAARGQQPVR